MFMENGFELPNYKDDTEEIFTTNVNNNSNNRSPSF